MFNLQSASLATSQRIRHFLNPSMQCFLLGALEKMSSEAHLSNVISTILHTSIIKSALAKFHSRIQRHSIISANNVVNQSVSDRKSNEAHLICWTLTCSVCTRGSKSPCVLCVWWFVRRHRKPYAKWPLWGQWMEETVWINMARTPRRSIRQWTNSDRSPWWVTMWVQRQIIEICNSCTPVSTWDCAPNFLIWGFKRTSVQWGCSLGPQEEWVVWKARGFADRLLQLVKLAIFKLI